MEIFGAFAPERGPVKEKDLVCLRDIRSDIFSIGGAIVFSICLAVTALAILATRATDTTSMQILIAMVLLIASWAYFFNSARERLCLADRSIVYTSVFIRRKTVPLDDLEAMLLVHQGFNLEHGIESIEFRRRDDTVDRIALGPCWQRHKLEAFLRSVEEALNDPDLLEEVR